MTFKCKSEDYGFIPLFNITTNGKIKFHINYLREKVEANEITKDYQLKLKAERLAEERRMEEEFKIKMAEKFAEDERLEQMNAQKRRMREL